MDVKDVMMLVLGVLVGLLSWLMREMWDQHKRLRDTLHEHKLHVAEQYVTRDDFKEAIDHIRIVCDNIWKAIREGK